MTDTRFGATDLLMTGTSGWLGTGLLNAVTTGMPDYPDAGIAGLQRVRCFYRDGEPHLAVSNARNLTIENVSGDLTDPAAVDALFAGTRDAIAIHTAGVIHPQRVSDFYRSNVESALNLVRAAAAHHCRRLVLVSSNSPIGCNPHPQHRFTEDSPYNPYQHYGRSKMQMEQQATALASELNLDLVIVRPPWFYGPFQPPRQTLFFSMIREGKGPLVGDGSNQRSMVYIDNLCYGLLLAATTTAARGETYWIADEHPYEMREVLDTIEQVLEEDFSYTVAHKRMRLPSVAADVAYWVDAAIQGTGLYHQKIHVLSEMNKNIACSVDKARRELGYAPKIALREGMRRSIGWCREQGFEI